ncbi:MAG: histidinol dehydrogenase [Pseudomonadota bacterium]
MAIYHLKTARSEQDRRDDERKVSQHVRTMIDTIEDGGDPAIRSYAEQFDGFAPDPFRLSEQQIEEAIAQVPVKDLDDIRFAQEQIRNFARLQKETIQDFECETRPGIILGQKNIPVGAAGCYVPGGKYPLIASAMMGVVTAKVAGVKRIVAASPPWKGAPHPYIVATMHLGGADEILLLGGVHAMAAMAIGSESIKPVDMLVGPGSIYVAEAKRQLFGRVGIDLCAGPTETLIIVDKSVDAELCATDLLGQAEHGPTSPAVMITNSRKLAEETLDEIERLLKILPTAHHASPAWRDYGEIIVCDSYEEMLAEGERIASEHVQIMTERDDWFLEHMTCYGALFLGTRTNVAYGDKSIGTNHTLPTRRAARYTGGLWVGKFIKTHTYQRVLTDEACVEIGEICSRISMMEGFAAHAEQANLRLRRYGGLNIGYAQPAPRQS